MAMASKADYFRSLWIPVEKRLPPDDDTKILYYNPEYDRIDETTGLIFNTWMYQMKNIPGMAEKIRANPAKNYLSGYFATYWMPRWRPE